MTSNSKIQILIGYITGFFIPVGLFGGGVLIYNGIWFGIPLVIIGILSIPFYITSLRNWR